MKLLASTVERLLAPEVSGPRLFFLNRVLPMLVPFNAPHRVEIVRLDREGVDVRLPYVRKNKNHVGGLHACGLATVAEFSSGIYLLSRLSFSRYRLLMKSMRLTYSKQGFEDAFAVFGPDKNWFDEHVLTKAKEGDEFSVSMEVRVRTRAGVELCMAEVEWHLKGWSAVGKARKSEAVGEDRGQ